MDDLERELLPEDREDAWATPGELAAALDPETVQTPALDLIDEFLVNLLDTPGGRGIITMPPQEGKTQRAVRRFCTWALKRNPNLRIVIASNEQQLARRSGRQVRDDVRQHPTQLGLTVRRDLSGQTEWGLAGYDGGVFSVGVGGGLIGRACDLMVIDDPIKNTDQADSKDYREKVWEWWTHVASTRLGKSAPVLVILTRWHDDDLAGRLLKGEDAHRWKLLHIPAQAIDTSQLPETDPMYGKPDVLGREPGEFLESSRGRTPEEWEQIKVSVGSRVWSALYQGRPTSATGAMFKRENWQTYDVPLWVRRPNGSRIVMGRFDAMLASWDMTFKDTKGTDLVVGQVWMRRGAEAFLLDQVRGRWDFVETCRQLRLFSAKWPQAVMKLVEDKANGSAVIAQLSRIVPGLIPEEPHGSKTSRAAAVSPLQESRGLWLPAPEIERDGEDHPYAWVGEFIEEHAVFPFGANDDQVDGTSQALTRLVLLPLQNDQIVRDSDLDEELDDFTIAPYA